MKQRILSGMLALVLFALFAAGCASKTESVPPAESGTPAVTEAPTPEPTAEPTPDPTPEPTPEPTPPGRFLWMERAYEFIGYTDDRTLLQSASEQFGMATDGKILFLVMANPAGGSAAVTHQLLEAAKLIGPDGAVYDAGVSAADGQNAYLEYDIPADANPADYIARIQAEDGTETQIALADLPVWTGKQP